MELLNSETLYTTNFTKKKKSPTTHNESFHTSPFFQFSFLLFFFVVSFVYAKLIQRKKKKKPHKGIIIIVKITYIYIYKRKPNYYMNRCIRKFEKHKYQIRLAQFARTTAEGYSLIKLIKCDYQEKNSTHGVHTKEKITQKQHRHR